MTKEFFINQYCRFEGPVTQMFSLLPEDKLEWSPAENTMPTGALVQHLIDSTQGMAASLVSGQWEPRPADLDGGRGKSKEQLLADVKSAFEQARTTLNQMTQEQFETARSKIEAGPVTMEGTAEELGVSLCLIHTANHVMQLFWYLRQSGVDADSGYPLLRDAAGTVLDSGVGDAGDRVACRRGEAPRPIMSTSAPSFLISSMTLGTIRPSTRSMLASPPT